MAAAAWADLPLDLLGEFMAHLPLPADRARFGAVCRPWCSAARQFAVHRLPWLVLPNGTFCTAGHGAAPANADRLFYRIPGLPENATCLGAAHDCWLALDCTDDVVRRTLYLDRLRNKDTFKYEFDVYARPGVKHMHKYSLHNPFSGVTVPLPELDAIIGHVAETFEVRKVLMRSSAPDDVIAVTTNNWNYNIILCRPGKGTFVLDEFRVVDVAFLGNTLYGITSGEELLAFHLGEDEDGKPVVTSIELVIKNPLAKYYERVSWLWPQKVVTRNDGEEPNQEENEEYPGDDEEEPNQEENVNVVEGNQEEDEEDDEVADQASEDSFNGDGMVSDNEMFDGYDENVSYETKDEIFIGRYLVKSQSGELLLLRHQLHSRPFSTPYTRKVEVFTADFIVGNWATSYRLHKDEAVFLSRSYSKCTDAGRGIQEGFVYYATQLDDMFDTTHCTTRNIAPGWPCQCRREYDELLTWLFPMELVV